MLTKVLYLAAPKTIFAKITLEDVNMHNKTHLSISSASNLYVNIALTCVLSGLFLAVLLPVTTTAQGNVSGEVAFTYEGDIYILNLETRNTNRLTTIGTVQRGSISWSPDGKLLAYQQTENEANSIWILNLDNKQTRKFADGSHPVWSPNGQWIAYTAVCGTNFCLYVKQSDQSETRKITQNSTYSDDSPAFSREGQLFFFRDVPDGDARHVYVMLYNFSQPETTVHDVGIAGTCGFGELSAYSNTLFSYGSYCGVRGRSANVVDLTTTKSTPAVGYCSYNGSWARSTPLLAFIETTHCDIFPDDSILNLGVYKYQQDTSFSNMFMSTRSSDVSSPTWSPDDQWLIYSGGGLWLISAQGEQRQQVSTTGESPAWRPLPCEVSEATGLNSCILLPGDILLIRGDGTGLFGRALLS